MMLAMRSSPAGCRPNCHGDGWPSAAIAETANNSIGVVKDAAKVPSFRIIEALFGRAGGDEALSAPCPGSRGDSIHDLGGPGNLSHCDLMPRRRHIPFLPFSD